MKQDQNIGGIAIRIMEAWLLASGFEVCGNWDERDKDCLRQYGPHLVCGTEAHTSEPHDYNALWKAFSQYLSQHNALPEAVHFEPYGLEVFSCPCGCGDYIYLSVLYQ